MIKTLMVSLLLKNTYQVNCIMYAIKQTPIIKHFLPDGFYGSYKVKCFANVLSVLWEIISTFAVKLIYFGAMFGSILNKWTRFINRCTIILDTKRRYLYG